VSNKTQETFQLSLDFNKKFGNKSLSDENAYFPFVIKHSYKSYEISSFGLVCILALQTDSTNRLSKYYEEYYEIYLILPKKTMESYPSGATETAYNDKNRNPFKFAFTPRRNSGTDG
jgi:hypothetical protein